MSAEAPVSDECVAAYTLREEDCREALMRYWEHKTRESLSLDLAVGLAILGALLFTGLAVVMYVHHESSLLTVVFAAVAGYSISSSTTTLRVFRLRRRFAGEYWDAVCAQGVRVDLFRTESGLSFRRGELDQTIRWIDVTTMFVAPSNRLWVCAVGEVVFWLPMAAFGNRDAFRDFTRFAAAQRDGARPSDKGFEVITTPKRDAPQ